MKGSRPISRAEIDVDAQRRQWLSGAGFALLTAAAPIFPHSARTLVSRRRGPVRVSVCDHGACGRGRLDATAAFQAAFDTLPLEGGTVTVPTGTYLIDPTRNLRLRSRMHLELSPAAVLKAIPNSAGRAYVLNVDRVSDVEISGGRIVGERDQHLGTTGEHGHGIMIRGSKRVTVRGVHISKCWGDGIQITQANSPLTLSEDVEVANVVCTGNRRQGLSVGGCRNVRVYDSEFSFTHGTAPQCGIDIEPEVVGLPTADIVYIENCLLRQNAKNGILIYKRVTRVTLTDCIIEHNGGYGIYTVSPAVGSITGNSIRHNYHGGSKFTAGTRDFEISGNTFRNNNTRFYGLRPQPGPVKAILGIATGYGGIDKTADSAIKVSWNHWSRN